MSEPIGWNIYESTSVRDVTQSPRFRKFIPNEPVLGEVASAFADEIEAYTAAAASCGAVLFPLPQRLRPLPPGTPIHPLYRPYFDPQNGPAPLVCTREPHPDSPWHWYDGTWWRSLCSGGLGGCSRRAG